MQIEAENLSIKSMQKSMKKIELMEFYKHFECTYTNMIAQNIIWLVAKKKTDKQQTESVLYRTFVLLLSLHKY